MRAFVTGGHGFVGPHLIDHLIASGDEVIAPQQQELDLDDAEALREALRTAQPDAVYHLAALAHVGDSWDDPRRTFAVNATGTLHLLEAARRCDPLPRVLLIGSAEVYGIVKPDQLPLSEDTPLVPVTPYAASKVAAEYLGVQYHAGYDLPVVRARSFNHVGPGQRGSFVVADIARRIADAIRTGDRAPIKVGNLAARRDFTDVRDVVRAYRLLIERGDPGAAYNVCSGVGTAVDELAHRLLALSDVDLAIEPDPALMRPVDVPVLIGDNRRLSTSTGWKPQIALDDTLRDVIRSFLDA
ncbi:MAG TPA: GDP-mannose 4,6-dehydratase [Acidimicrobiales bacterium]|nr:GDP-mannose 4,6-dehydratase [Acidimicrobiales bacterium]